MERLSKELLYPKLMGCKCYKKNDDIYFFAKNFNALCKIDIKVNSIEIVESLCNERFDKEYLVGNLLNYKDELICVPSMASQIYIIDMKERRETGKLISDQKIMKGRVYWNVYLEDGNCYLFPFTGNECIQVDIEQRKIIRSIDVRKIYKDILGENYKYFSCSDHYIYKNKVYMAMFETAIIVEVDIPMLRIQFYKMEGKSSHYIHITGCENLLYILGVDGKIYVWNSISHEVENTLQLKFGEEEIGRFTYSVKSTKYIYIFKYIASDEFIRIDCETNQAEVLSLSETFKIDENKRVLLSFMTAEKNKFYFLSETYDIFVVDFSSKDVSIFPLSLNEDEIYRYIKKHERELNEIQTEAISEGKYIWTLENYIGKYIDMERDRQTNKCEDVGNKILTAAKIDLRL